MRNLLNFLQKYNYWFLFLLLEVASFVLLFRFNRYQQSVFFTSAGGLAGKVYEMADGITSYFHLKAENSTLLDRNLYLESQVARLEEALHRVTSDSLRMTSLAGVPAADYRLYKASVIKNSLSRMDNYITLDRGEAAGVRPDMGVAGTDGVVGIVYKVSPRYALVLPVLNSRSNLSCMIQGSGYFGYLRWEGGDPRYAWLEDLPRHAEFELGDTVVTSGYSAVFPQGVTVGTVDDAVDADDGLSYRLKIRLATDFGRLDAVRILARTGREEQKHLEEEGL